jgi:hypothetical protein
LPALVAIVALASYVAARGADRYEPAPPPSAAPPPPYTDEARALLRGLDAGDVVEGWRVAEIHGPVNERIVIRFERRGVSVSVSVARISALGSPPLAKGPYGIYFSPPEPADAVLEAGATTTLIEGVSRHIERFAPLPAGM